MYFLGWLAAGRQLTDQSIPARSYGLRPASEHRAATRFFGVFSQSVKDCCASGVQERETAPRSVAPRRLSNSGTFPLRISARGFPN